MVALLDLINTTTIPLDENNRMLRLGFGKHDGRLFFRIDLWLVGYRITYG